MENYEDFPPQKTGNLRSSGCFSCYRFSCIPSTHSTCEVCLKGLGLQLHPSFVTVSVTPSKGYIYSYIIYIYIYIVPISFNNILNVYSNICNIQYTYSTLFFGEPEVHWG